jgi:hypothetical protein
MHLLRNHQLLLSNAIKVEVYMNNLFFCKQLLFS